MTAAFDDQNHLISGELIVGFVTGPVMTTKKFAWEISAVVGSKYLPFKLYGERSTRAAAQRAALDAWRKWLDYAGLVEASGVDNPPAAAPGSAT